LTPSEARPEDAILVICAGGPRPPARGDDIWEGSLDKIDRAIVLATRSGVETLVAGMPLAVRMVLALRAAGFDDVSVAARDRPRWVAEPLARRGVSVRWLDGDSTSADSPSCPGPLPAPVLVLEGDVLVDAAAVATLRVARPGPVWTTTGQLVGRVTSPGDVTLGLDGPAAPDRQPGAGNRMSGGLAVPLAVAGSAARLERALLDHLADRPTADSYLAALLDRPMSRPVTRRLLRTRLTPSQVTALGVAIGLLGAMGLATASYWERLVGVLLLVASLVLDCVDGDLARARLTEAPAGAWLDLIGDYLVNLSVFGALAVGLLREGLPPGGGWAALALVTGVAAAMAVVHVVLIRPALQRGGDLHWAGDDWSLHGRPGAAVVEKLASRDYTYLLLVLAVAGHLEWFLYAAAVGAWVFTGVVVTYGLVALPGRCPESAPR
jgi:phosphatidylglycerophosphate synthase